MRHLAYFPHFEGLWADVAVCLSDHLIICISFNYFVFYAVYVVSEEAYEVIMLSLPSPNFSSSVQPIISNKLFNFYS
jgi:hypothetical protein